MAETVSRKNIIYDVIFKTDSKGIKGATTQINKAEKATDSFAKTAGKAAAALGAMFAIGAVVKGATDTILDFGTAIGSLKAITGASAKDLEFYKQQARAIGATTSVSAVEAVKAFEIIGSASPKLLESREALAAVTKEAVVLAQASGLELPDAAMALTTALNQFQIPAENAAEVVNTLAAGAKFGAAAIPLIAESLEKFGTVAASSNIDLKQSTAMIELLAERGLQGAEAGTQLRNVILKLQQANLGFKDGVFDINVALKELNAKQLSSNELTKIFGMESVVAGQIMVENTTKLAKLTEQMNTANVALEQQEAQTETLKDAMDRIGTAWDSVVLGLEGSTGGIAKVFISVADNMQRIVRMVGSLTATFVTYKAIVMGVNVATRAGAIASRAYRLALVGIKGGARGAAVAIKGFRSAIISTGIGALVVGVGLLVDKMIGLAIATDDAAVAQREYNAAASEGLGMKRRISDLQTQVDTMSKLDKDQLDNLQRNVEVEIDMASGKNARLLALAHGQADEILKLEEEKAAEIIRLNKIIDSEETQPHDVEAAQMALMTLKGSFAKSAAEEMAIAAEGITQKELEEGQKQLENLAAQVSARIALMDKVGEGNKSLIKEKQKEIATAKLMSEGTEQEIATKHRLLIQLNNQLQVLKDLGKEKDRLAELSEIMSEITKQMVKEHQAGGIATDTIEKYNKAKAEQKEITEAVAEAQGKAIKPAEDLEDAIKELGDEILATAKGFEKALSEEAEAMEALQQAVTDISMQTADVLFDLHQEKLEKQKEEIEKQYEWESEMLQQQLDNKLLTQEQYDREQLGLKQQFLHEQLAIEKKQAALNKASRISEIMVDLAATIADITFKIAKTSGAGAAIWGASLGVAIAASAIAIASIVAEPLPGLKKGTKSAKEGMYEVGEAGPEIMYVPEGAQVMSNQKRKVWDAIMNDRLDALTLNDHITRTGQSTQPGARELSGRRDHSDYKLRMAIKGNKSVNIENAYSLAGLIGNSVGQQFKFQKWYN